MSQLHTAAVSVEDGQVTIDAEALAVGLGLSVEALKDKMIKGLVTSVTEAGEGQDEGCVRLTFRYRARLWRIVVKADGTLVEDPVKAF